ncbi:MAG TPA: hypothetical protein PLO89_11450, partial [Spirochaetota bacterium]|nr:hypothetical protein [Spirochaetota bacterium]
EYDNYLESLSYQKSVIETAKIEGIIEGKIEGKIEGEIIGKQNSLIKQLIRKFGLNDEEIELIKICKDMNKLDSALDEILFANDKKAF